MIVTGPDNAALGIPDEIQDDIPLGRLRETGFHFGTSVRDVISLIINRIVNILDVPDHIGGESAAAESALQSGREDAVRDLAAGVAHEIGNPLNALNIHLQLLERRLKADAVPPDPGMLLQDVQVARSEVKRLDSILKQFLYALRPAKPVFTAASLADPLKETLAILKGDLVPPDDILLRSHGKGVCLQDLAGGYVAQCNSNIVSGIDLYNLHEVSFLRNVRR